MLELSIQPHVRFNYLEPSLSALYQAALAVSLPVALWRRPHQTQPEALVDFSGSVRRGPVDLSLGLPGFIFSPFPNPGGQESLYFKANLYLDETGLHQPFSQEDEHNESNQAAFFKAYTSHLTTISSASPTWIAAVRDVTGITYDQAEYCHLVAEAVNYITESPVDKIVLSQIVETPLPVGFDPLRIFQTLSHRYPHAFISLVAVPGLGTWLGASPEPLLSIQPTSNGGTLQTVALAGTQARPESLDQVQWTPKEIEEQALVSNYIRQFLRDLNLPATYLRENGPYTVSAGNVVHLKTEFSLNLPQAQLWSTGNRILSKMHPTSAVCGLPKDEALTFILNHEKHVREFYSGYLGPVHLPAPSLSDIKEMEEQEMQEIEEGCRKDDNSVKAASEAHLPRPSQLFVNLRCMQLTAKTGLLYVGGGITQDSNPEAEWAETILKSKTLLSILAAPETPGHVHTP